ncbi:MAG TPA: hypothetical protein VMV79_07030, partial [Alphaproteobacteria bacterium]|nr:hypothetical protein [Alphaproteobacteria bacterium]
FGEAEEMARRAIAFGAPKAQALNSLGLALGRQAKFAEAEKTLREAMALAPGDAQIAANLANLYVDQLRFEETWPLFVEARAKNDAPAIRHHEGMARLLAGDYQTGWELCEARLQPPVNLRVQPACPRWRGETLIGKKLLLVAEQGQGDTIQFCRYGGLLAKSGAQLAWVMQKSLQCLLAANLPGIVLADDEPLPEADFYLPLLSLPLALGLYAPQNAPPVPYLRAPVKLALPAGDGESRKIGLVWSGSKTHERDAERSIPLARFAPLWEKTGAKPAVFYAPFIGEDLEQSANYPVVPLDDFIGDFADTASLLMQLDCLVTVDTAAAHLAGALGVKTYLLLPYCPDWRWGTKGEATAWYASVTLLRQPQPGDWDGVMARLTDRLAI